MSQPSFRCLPAVDSVMRDDRLQQMSRLLPRQQLLRWIRQAIDDCRQQMATGVSMTEEAALAFVVPAALS